MHTCTLLHPALMPYKHGVTEQGSKEAQHRTFATPRIPAITPPPPPPPSFLPALAAGWLEGALVVSG